MSSPGLIARVVAAALTVTVSWSARGELPNAARPVAMDAGTPARAAVDAGVPPVLEAGSTPGMGAGTDVEAAPASERAVELPHVEPDPSVASVIEEEAAGVLPEQPIAPRERPEVLIKIILGLIALMVLAYLGGHPRVQQLEETLRISQVITTGFPFVLLGLVARLPSVGVLTDEVLAELGPILRLGLGWIGFVVGFRFDVRLFQRLPSQASTLVVLGTVVPFATVVAACGTLLLATTGLTEESIRDPVFIRDAIILGSAGAMTAWSVTRLFAQSESVQSLEKILRLEELAGVVGLAIVAAYFRPQGANVSWQLPGTAWVFVTLGLGMTVAGVVYVILQRASAGPDFAVLMVGSVSFAAGIAGYLYLSSVVVSFIAGALVANLPGAYKDHLNDTLHKLERPIYLLSLVVIGALWRVDDWRGWLLIPVFAVSRIFGKWLGTTLSLRRAGMVLPVEERLALTAAPMGTLAIAVVVNAQLLYPGGSISQIVAAVIGGAVLFEVLVQLLIRRAMVRPAPSGPA